jgi:hypothetical protein
MNKEEEQSSLAVKWHEGYNAGYDAAQEYYESLIKRLKHKIEENESKTIGRNSIAES